VYNLPAPSKERTPSNVKLAIMVLVLGLAYFFSNFHRLSLSVISPNLAADFNIDAAGLGILGSAYFYPYAAMQIPAGSISDRFGTRLTVSISLVIAAIGSLWFGSAKSLTELVIARGFIGLAVAFIYVPALGALRTWFSEKNFGVLTGLMLSMGMIGALSTSVPLAFLSKLYGWRGVFSIIGFVSLALAVLSWFTVLGKKVEQKSTAVTKKSAEYSANLKKIILKPGFIILVIWFFFFAGTKLAFQSLWGAQYFSNVYHFNPDQISLTLLLLAVGNIVGSPLAGRLADIFGNFKILVWTGLLCTILWGYMALVSGAMPFSMASIFYLVLGLLSGGCLSSSFSSIRTFASKEYSGSLLGYTNCAAFLGGAIMTQGTGSLLKMLSYMGIVTSYRILYFLFFIVVGLLTLLLYLTNWPKKLEDSQEVVASAR